MVSSLSRWLVLAVVLLMPSLSHAQSKSKRPNVLVLFSDDQRADTIAVLGNSHIKTPNLDKLVRRGTAFKRAYCMGAMQGAVCVPSRAMLLSGRSLFNVPENLQGVTTWPAIFARLGYRTFMTGKWHNQEASALNAFLHGKTIFFGGMGAPYTLPVADITPQHTLTKKRPSGKHSFELFADSTIEFIQQQKKGDDPFLAYVAFNGPHDPRLAPKEYHEPYNKNKPPLPPNYLPVHPFNNGELVNRDERLAPWPRTPEIVRQNLADYYASITFLDEQIGRILAALREAGLEEDTIIVFASDSGLAIGSHGLFGKQNIYDDGMRTPLIFAGPGVPPGKQSDALCYLFDIFPTLGDLAGVTGPDKSEGKSLVPVLKGDKKEVRDALLLAYRQFQRSVIDDRWQLIMYPHINKTQLFDLKNDPYEVKDLAVDPTYVPQITRLTAKLKELQKEFNDKQPLRSDNPEPQAFDFTKIPPIKKKQPPAPKMSYLDNGTIKLGVDLALGGAITYLSPAKQERNVVNSYDFGRQIQMSYYAGPVPYFAGAKRPDKHWWHLGWNPIQTGDDFGFPALVLDHRNDGTTLYVQCVPMQWPLNNEPGECTFECWINLEGAQARIKCRLNNQRRDPTQYPARTQEMPAVYTNAPYHRLMTYTGDKPFTNDALTQMVRPKDHVGPWLHWLATECWAAHVDDQGWGLGVWHPGVRRFSGGFAGTPGQGGAQDNPTGYIAPNRQEILDHNLRHEYEYVLILGSVEEIRAQVTRDSKPPTPPAYRFQTDRQGCYYVNAGDKGWPIQGELNLLLDKDDPQLIAPATFFAAADAPVCRIEAALHSKETTAQIFWDTHAEPGFRPANSVTFPILGDGKLRTYEVPLARSATYRGHITGVRFDPIPTGSAGDTLRLKSIVFGK